MCCIEVVHFEGQVEFVITKVVWLLTVAKPSQLQLMFARTVLKIDDDETAVFGIDATNLVHAKMPCGRIRGCDHVTASQDDVVIDEPLSIQRTAIVDALEKADSKVLDEVERLLKRRGLIN